MAVEQLHSTELQHLLYLSPVALGYIGWLWRKLKQERSQKDGIPVERLEIDHIKPKWMGGTDDPKNLAARTLPEHAEKHRELAKRAKDRKSRAKERGAVSMIVQRMTPDELDEFNRRLQT